MQIPFLIAGGTALAGGLGTFLGRSHLWAVLNRWRARLAPEARLLAAASPDAVLILDERGRITFWNPAAEQMFGYTRAEVLGRPVHEVLPPSGSRQKACEAYERFWKQGAGMSRANTFERIAVRKDGTELPVEITGVTLKRKGRWYACGTIRDISERKRREEEVRQAKDRAEQMAAELAGVNTMFEQTTVWAKEMAAQAAMANAAKSAFLASMSHEIRTPMNGVLGMLTLLEQTPLTSEQADYVGTIRYSGEILLDIINQILDFSRIESGKLELEDLEFDLRDEVEQVVSLLGERAEAKHIDLLETVSPAVPRRVRGDSCRLRQILINLTGNAIKFTAAGEVSIAVDAAPAADGRVELSFAVRDTGIGIPADRLKNLFQPFYQVDSSTRRKFGGTGLGLAISKRLVEAMGGEIRVESVVRKGTEFSFSVLVTIAAGPHGPDADRLLPENARVLLCLHSSAVREMLSAYLQAWQLEPVEAPQADEITEALVRSSRVLIADLGSPDTGALLDRLARFPAGSRPAIVLIVSPNEHRSSETLGADALLARPVRESRLRATLEALVGDPGGHSLAQLAEPVQPSSRAETPHGRILVAEDNAINGKLALKLLERLGYAADLVENGELAVSRAAQGQYSIVLMDCQMPIVDGYGAAGRIRKLSGFAGRVPIIALTASALKGDRERCLNAGMSDYITKPIRVEELKAALERWDGREHLQLAVKQELEW